MNHNSFHPLSPSPSHRPTFPLCVCPGSGAQTALDTQPISPALLFSSNSERMKDYSPSRLISGSVGWITFSEGILEFLRHTEESEAVRKFFGIAVVEGTDAQALVPLGVPGVSY